MTDSTTNDDKEREASLDERLDTISRELGIPKEQLIENAKRTLRDPERRDRLIKAIRDVGLFLADEDDGRD